MQTIQEIYATSIQPLSEPEKLRLANLILKELIRKKEEKKTQKKGSGIRKHFGMFNSGDTNSADNDKIDADLARAYLEDYERSKS